jgi:hypothetical protein
MSGILDQLNQATANNADQRSKDWHDNRAARVTSSIMYKLLNSDAAASGSKEFKAKHFGFGIGAVSIIKQKAMEKFLGRAIVDDLDNVWNINFGKNWEPAAIGMTQMMMGVSEIQSSPPFIKWEKYPHLAGGSPDHLSNILGVGETKCTADEGKQLERWRDIRTLEDMKNSKDKVIFGAYWQLHSSALFSGIDVITFTSFCPLGFAGYTDDREYLDFSVGFAFENTPEHIREMYCHTITGEVNRAEFDVIEDIVVRYEKLLNQEYEKILDRARKPIPFKING